MANYDEYGEPTLLAALPRARGDELRITIETHLKTGRRWGRLQVWFRDNTGGMKPGKDHVSLKLAEITEAEKALAAMRVELERGAL